MLTSSSSPASAAGRGRGDDREVGGPARDAAHPLLLLQRDQPQRLPRGSQAEAPGGRPLHLRVRRSLLKTNCADTQFKVNPSI